MSKTTFNEEKNCPEYFKYEGKVYQCVGNDDNQFWAIIDGESKGFEQSNCIKLYPKTAYVASDFVTDISILVNGEICMVDHIKPYDFSTSVKDGYCVVFENEERCILETEESDIIKIFEPTYEAPPTPSKELKSAEEVLKEVYEKWRERRLIHSPNITFISFTEVMGLDSTNELTIPAMEAYASQPQPTADTGKDAVTEAVEDGKQGGEVKVAEEIFKAKYLEEYFKIHNKDDEAANQSFVVTYKMNSILKRAILSAMEEYKSHPSTPVQGGFTLADMEKAFTEGINFDINELPTPRVFFNEFINKLKSI